MMQASGGPPRPENRSELLYWKLRKMVWLIALGLTVFGALVVAPFVERPLRLVLLAPLVYVFFYAIIRSAFTCVRKGMSSELPLPNRRDSDE